MAALSLYKDAELKKIYPYLDAQLGILKSGNGKAVRPPCPIYSTLEGIYGLQLNKVLTGAVSLGGRLEGDRHAVHERSEGQLDDPVQLSRATTIRWRTPRS